MWLINVDTFKVESFVSADAAPPYAILSHRWRPGEQQVLYKDLEDLERASTMEGFYKIRCACAQAKLDGLQYAWVDCCCIDKSSSHELAEAINSMFGWYKKAVVCYVYLYDVPWNCPSLADSDINLPSALHFIDRFESSEWFTRGWTLQELIAPRTVLFFGCMWNPIGALADMLQRVSNITDIPMDILDNTRPLSDLSIAQRLSWAARRRTSRIEDEAYSLFGILDINLAPIHGEGANAFLRLQEHLISRFTDQSIFAWNPPPGEVVDRESLFAPSPRCFVNGSRIRRRRGTAGESAFSLNNKGLEITLPLVRRRLHGDQSRPYVTLGLLDCRYEGSSQTLALIMDQHPYDTQSGKSAHELYISGLDMVVNGTWQYSRLLVVSAKDLEDAEPTLVTITKDLQSQKYIKVLNANDVSWFPLKFMGGDSSQMPSLRDYFPAQCWHNSSQTLRLSVPKYPYGGIVVDTRDGSSVLICFKVSVRSSRDLRPSRSVCGAVVIDPKCPMEPHLWSLVESSTQQGAHNAFIRLGRLTAHLSHGALNVSVESEMDDAFPSYALPPTPTSPTTSFSKSLPVPDRRGSMAKDRRESLTKERRESMPRDRRGSTAHNPPPKNRRDSVFSEGDVADSRDVAFLPSCPNCRARRDREIDDQRRRTMRAEEEYARRKKEAKGKRFRERAGQAAAGGTLLSVMSSPSSAGMAAEHFGDSVASDGLDVLSSDGGGILEFLTGVFS